MVNEVSGGLANISGFDLNLLYPVNILLEGKFGFTSIYNN